MEAVSLTPQWTAAVRALEAERGQDRLFVDALAHELAKPKGFELLERYAGAGVQDFVSIRTRYVDDAIETVISAARTKQIVMVAAGMDSRAFRLEWPEGVTLYEVDHQALLEEKRRRLLSLGAQAKTSRIEVAADLATDWLDRLQQAGLDTLEKTLWIAEGLLFFLSVGQVRSLLEALKDASAPGSWLVTDMVSRTLLTNPASQTFLAKLRSDGIPWLFGTDDPERFLRAHGWALRDQKEPGNPGAGQGRWPYKVVPRSVRGVPRSWLIQAERQ